MDGAAKWSCAELAPVARRRPARHVQAWRPRWSECRPAATASAAGQPERSAPTCRGPAQTAAAPAPAAAPVPGLLAWERSVAPAAEWPERPGPRQASWSLPTDRTAMCSRQTVRRSAEPADSAEVRVQRRASHQTQQWAAGSCGGQWLPIGPQRPHAARQLGRSSMPVSPEPQGLGARCRSSTPNRPMIRRGARTSAHATLQPWDVQSRRCSSQAITFRIGLRARGFRCLSRIVLFFHTVRNRHY